MRNKTFGLLAAGILLGASGSRFFRSKHIEVGPCGAAINEWGLEMQRLIDEYNAAHPNSPLVGDDAYKHFLGVNPYPSSIRIPKYPKKRAK